jgi:hypothetical protein
MGAQACQNILDFFDGHATERPSAFFDDDLRALHESGSI